MKKVEIVCLGNNGRSPIGETVFKDEAAKRGLDKYVGYCYYLTIAGFQGAYNIFQLFPSKVFAFG